MVLAGIAAATTPPAFSFEEGDGRVLLQPVHSDIPDSLAGGGHRSGANPGSRALGLSGWDPGRSFVRLLLLSAGD